MSDKIPVHVACYSVFMELPVPTECEKCGCMEWLVNVCGCDDTVVVMKPHSCKQCNNPYLGDLRIEIPKE